MGTVHRRHFLVVAGALLGAPRAFAQAPKHAHIGYLSYTSRGPISEYFAGAMGKLGWVEGRNLTVDWRYAAFQPERTPAMASELLKLGVKVIVALSSEDALTVRRATRLIPIVTLIALEPVKLGLAESIAHPGGNVTGVIYGDTTISAKGTQLLKEALPGVKRVAYLYPTNDRGIALFVDDVVTAATSFGVTMLRFPIARVSDIGLALASVKKQRVDALRVVLSAATQAGMDEILAFSAANRLPSVWPLPDAVERGGFMSYSPSFAEFGSLGASLVDKILRGANPAEMAFQYPTRYELVINLKTAKQLGITVPHSIITRADRVIE